MTVSGPGVRAANSFKQIVELGSGVAAATVGVNPRNDGTHGLYLYDVSDPRITTKFLTAFLTPGLARSVTIYNGIAYVAASDSGLQILNLNGIDTLRKPPAGILTSDSTRGQVTAGARVVFQAKVTDDVQIRNVEFYMSMTSRRQPMGTFPSSSSGVLPPIAPGVPTVSLPSSAIPVATKQTSTSSN